MMAATPHRENLERQGPIAVGEYHRMIETGILGEDEGVELIAGTLVAMTPQGSRHAVVVQRLTMLLARFAGDDLAVRTQLPLTLSADSEPEPDLAVVLASDAPIDGPHPGRALLVVEVAGDSLALDSRSKAALYARAGIPEYWIVSLADSSIEVRSDPDPAIGTFRESSSVAPGGAVASRSLPGLSVDVARLFG